MRLLTLILLTLCLIPVTVSAQNLYPEEWYPQKRGPIFLYPDQHFQWEDEDLKHIEIYQHMSGILYPEAWYPKERGPIVLYPDPLSFAEEDGEQPSKMTYSYWYQGLYFAPKLMYAEMQMQGMKGEYRGAKTKKDNSESIFGGGLAAGYDFYPKFNAPLRTELELSLFSPAEDSCKACSTKFTHKIDTMALFVNAYVDIHNRTIFTPYAGAGIGMAFIDYKGKISYQDENLSSSKTATNFAWNLSAGVDVKINRNLTAGLGYRFADFGKTPSTNTTGSGGKAKNKVDEIYMHQIGLSLRYTL